MDIKKPVLLLFCLFSLFCLEARQKGDLQNDSLEIIIKKSSDAYAAFNYKDAIKHASAVIEKAKKIHEAYYTFLGYDMLGGIYLETGDTLKGRQYSEKALKIARATGQDSLIAWGTMNMGILYSENKNTYDKAIRYFEESIVINEKIGELEQVHLTYISLAWTYLDHDRLNDAYRVLNKARAIAEKIEVDYINNLYIELLFGRYYKAKKNYGRAIGQLDFIVQKADKDSITDLALTAYEHLTEIYNETNDYKNAYLHLKKYNHYKEKAFDIKRIEETEKASAQFDLKQAQNNLEAAIREKKYADEITSKSKSLSTIFIGATITLALAFLSLFLFFKTRKKYVDELKNKNEELKIAKEKAEKLSKVKTKFLSTVSHELRTPLYGVIGISGLLQNDKKLKAYEEDLNSLKFSADYLLALINDVLLLSKIDAEAITLSEIPYELDLLLKNIIKSFEFRLKQNENKLHLEIDDGIPNRLIGDSVRISQILMNLVGNAVKFTKKGNIWLKLDFIETSGENLYKTRFSVKDDGQGIPEDKQKMIFDEFTQIDNKNHNYEGTGLGLTIVKKILKLYQSEIRLESQPGQGSTFSFLLNLKKNVTPEAKAGIQNISTDEIHKTFRKNKKRILIVDDNRINQKVTQKILEKYHIESSLANNGDEAVSMSKTNDFDMILMDINMPETNGMEAAIMIRKFDKNIPIIALTAVELDEMRSEIMNSGINDIIHKPYDITEFLNIILKNIVTESISAPE